MARTHINSCDFSLGNCALCDTADDTSLSSFSLERDKKMLIPMIQDALKKTKDELLEVVKLWNDIIIKEIKLEKRAKKIKIHLIYFMVIIMI